MARSIELSTQLQCNPAAAFRSWTDADLIRRWWGDPDAYQVVAWTGDLVEGGDWSAEFNTADGNKFGARGAYCLISAPEKLEWTWSADWDPDSVIDLEMTFRPEGEGTRLSLRAEGFADAAAAAEGVRGWNEITGWLMCFHATEARRRA